MRHTEIIRPLNPAPAGPESDCPQRRNQGCKDAPIKITVLPLAGICFLPAFVYSEHLFRNFNTHFRFLQGKRKGIRIGKCRKLNQFPQFLSREAKTPVQSPRSGQKAVISVCCRTAKIINQAASTGQRRPRRPLIPACPCPSQGGKYISRAV